MKVFLWTVIMCTTLLGLVSCSLHPEDRKAEGTVVNTSQDQVINLTDVKIKKHELVDKTSDISTSTFKRYYYKHVICDADWDQTCNSHDTVYMDAPSGWQICNYLLGKKDVSSKGSFLLIPASFENNPNNRTPRFRRFIIRVAASGSHAPWDRWGAWAKAYDIGLELIRSEANNEERFRKGCQLLERGQAIGDPGVRR